MIKLLTKLFRASSAPVSPSVSTVSIPFAPDVESLSEPEDDSEPEPSGPRVPIAGNLVPKRALFTPAERRFLKVLQEAVGQRALLMGKVRLWDLMDAKGGLQYRDKMSLWGRLKQKHVDYVLVEIETFRVICGVELDDRSHQNDKAKARDAVKNELFASSGIPLLRFPTAKEYEVKEVVTRLREVGLN